MLETILNLIFPPVCGICNQICLNNLCEECEETLKEYKLNIRTNFYVHSNKYFDNLINIFRYKGIIRKKIIEYKFGDKPYLYKTFAEIILKSEKIYGNLKNYDIIIPVPISKTKKHIRGYNQTELIAKEISKRIANLEYVKNVLIKKIDTKPQSLLNKKERKENIKNVFCINNENRVIGKKIILFDDIYTTGATAGECSKMLKQFGAKEVLVLTIARD